MATQQELIVFGTLGCLLCEEARALAVAEAERAGFSVHDVDVADDPRLLALYGERIPVVKRADRQLELSWPFDRQMLRLLLQDDA